MQPDSEQGQHLFNIASALSSGTFYVCFTLMCQHRGVAFTQLKSWAGIFFLIKTYNFFYFQWWDFQIYTSGCERVYKISYTTCKFCPGNIL